MSTERSSWKGRSPLSKATAPVAALLAVGVAIWFYWHPVLRNMGPGIGFGDIMKYWFVGDQLSYMATASNVRFGRPAYIEPFTATGWSVYPSGYYWLIGTVARVTGQTVFFTWNALGIALTAGLAVACGAWARHIVQRSWAWALGAAPLLVGMLQLDLSPDWRETFGANGVLWPPFAVLINPNGEAAGMFLVLVAVLLMTKAFGRQSPHLALLTGAGALLGLTLNVHTYSAIFGTTVVAMATVAWSLAVMGSGRRALLCVASLGSALLLTSQGVVDSPLVALGVMLVGLLLPVLVISDWRQRLLKPLVLLFAGAAVFASPVLVRIALDVVRPDSFTRWRSGAAASLDLSLPAGPVLVATLPLLLIAGVAVVSLLRTKDGRNQAIAATLTGAIVASVLLIFNAAWGMNQEPYRFFPYAMLLVAAVALPWLVTRLRTARAAAVRVALVAVLAPSILTTVAFHREAGGTVMVVTAANQEAFRTIAEAAPRDGTILSDTCVKKRVLKAATPALTTDMNRGMARPLNHEAIRKVSEAAEFGHPLPSDTELREAGVGAFLTASYCREDNDAWLEERFGKPIAVVPITDAAECGLEPDASYRLYRVGPPSDVPPIAIPPQVSTGRNAPTPLENCAYQLGI